MCKDYASHGYIVFAINHCDNSSCFFLDKNARPYYYDNKHKKYHLETRSAQLKIRVMEMKALIEEITDNLTILPKLGFGKIKITSDKVVVAGHSFGAITALKTSLIDGRIKAGLIFDPWLYVSSEIIDEGSFVMERPFITTLTEHFVDTTEGFDLNKSLEKLHASVKKGLHHEQVNLKTAYHTDQTDWSTLSPLEL